MLVLVLVDGDVVIFDSLAIMEYANDVSGGSYLLGALSLADWPLTLAWTARLMARPSVQKWMDVAEAKPPVGSEN